MKKKINIAELLKDCPQGMELDCTMYDNCTYGGIEDYGYKDILINTPSGQIRLTKEGCYFRHDDNAKCVIFPKDKTTWEGFVTPCKFKDGEVLYLKTVYEYEYIFINKIIKILGKPKYYKYASFNSDSSLIINDAPITYKENVKEIRLATSEEKEKLFQAIKENGYEWDEKTKTLEKLPKFKVGDRVHNKNYKDYIYDIYDITDKGYRAKEIDADSPIIILFGSQEDNYELVPNKFDITVLKPFESKVLVRDNGGDLWKPAIYGFSHSKGYYVVGGVYWRQCIPYKDNEYLLNTTNDCDEFYKTW